MEVAWWEQLPNVQEKCKSAWMTVLTTDAALEKLCKESHNDPLAMTMACLSDPEKYSHTGDSGWRAAHAAAQAQRQFTRYIFRVAEKYRVNVFSIRGTCDPLTLPTSQ